MTSRARTLYDQWNMTNLNDFSERRTKNNRDIHSQIHLSAKHQARLNLERLINAGSVSTATDLVAYVTRNLLQREGSSSVQDR